MDEKLKNQSVQTYVEDMTKALEENKEGIIKKLIHEEEMHDAEKKNLSPESRKNKLYMIFGIIFFVLALGTVVSFLVLKKDINTAPVAPEYQPIIFLDDTGIVEIGGMNKEEIAANARAEVNSSAIRSGQVEGIYFTEGKKIIGLRRFLALTESAFWAGDEVYISDNFLMGATVHKEKDLFFLLRVRSFADAFPLIRPWEEHMFRDLHDFFGVPLDAETKYLLDQPFKDGVLGNKNARVLYDNTGEIVFLYLFADENSIIISRTEASAAEIMLRLVSGEIKK